MRKISFISGLILLLVVAGCKCTKNAAAYDKLTANGWELEYITGVRIAFEGLYPDTKPQLSFTKTGEANGNSSCNPFSTQYTTKDINGIKIEAPKAMTMRCSRRTAGQYDIPLHRISPKSFLSVLKLDQTFIVNVYVSFDQGQTWPELPNFPIYNPALRA